MENKEGLEVLEEVDVKNVQKNFNNNKENFKEVKKVLDVEELIKIAKNSLVASQTIYSEIDMEIGSITDDIVRHTCHSIVQVLKEAQ